MIKDYEKPGFAVDIVMITGQGNLMKILTITRKKEPFLDCHVLPGGFVNQGETAYEAAMRELMEETNIDANNMSIIPLSTRTRPGRDPRGWIISSPFLIYAEEEIPCIAGDDANTAEWTSLNSIEEFGFDHGSIVCEALSKFWHQFPNSDSHMEGILPYGMSYGFESDSKRINSVYNTILFGGSFDPWHEGHEHLMSEAIRQDKYAYYLIVPDQNPLKPLKNDCAWKHYQTVFRNSIKIHRATYDGTIYMKNKLIPNVYPGFLGLEYGNNVSSWYGKIKVPGKLSYLMGDDTFLRLTSWPRYDIVADWTERFIVIKRSFDREDVESFSLKNNLPIRYIDTNPFSHISSTIKRENYESCG